MARPKSHSTTSQPTHSTSPSVGSTATASSVGTVFFLPQYMNVPEPSYISLEAANAIVSSYPAPETTKNIISGDVIVTDAGLRTINLFLDYILHEFLARGRSTSLYRLREAVALVIRTALGTAAMVEAEQELAVNLHDSDTELYDAGDESDGDFEKNEAAWNLEKVWARARVKCMIYSTLGDKEEEDFDEEEEDEADYDIPASKRKLSAAGAIYLIAVLEFIGEHCFIVAARHAYHRLAHSIKTTNPQSAPIPLTIEDADVKRGIAEDDLTTRLWRKWKRSEKLLSTMSIISAVNAERGDSSRADSTLTRLPFGPTQLARRSSIVSAPDMSRGESSDTIEARTKSLPISPTKAAAEKKNRNRHSKVYFDSKNANESRRDSVSNIKETLGERGVTLPDSPHSSGHNSEEFLGEPSSSRPNHRQSFSESDINGFASGTSKRDANSAQVEDDDTTEYHDSLTSPQKERFSRVEPVDDDLKTPTLEHPPQLNGESKTEKKDEDAVVVGGDAGFDFSIWETRTPTDQRFYFSPPSEKRASRESDASYKIINQHPEDESVPTINLPEPSEHTAEFYSDVESLEVRSMASAEPEPVTEARALRIQLPQASPAVIVLKSTTSNQEEDTESLPGSWPKQDGLQVPEDRADGGHESDASSHVNDKIANQFAELERGQEANAAIGLGFDNVPSHGMSTVTVRNLTHTPYVLTHTELTPIIEASPRESMASDYMETVNGSRRNGATTGWSTEETRERVASPPPTKSSNKGLASPISPSGSIRSIGRARSSSLSSQAERLRNKFMRKASVDEDSNIVEEEPTSPVRTQRRMKFESLIRSGETMKLTLTPNTLRVIENETDDTEQRTIPSRVRKQADENSTRELADFLRSTGPESYLGSPVSERRPSLPNNQLTSTSPPGRAVRSVPSTPILRQNKSKPTPPLPRFVPREAATTSDPDHSTLQLAAFLRTTGPNEPPVVPITLGSRHLSEKTATNSIHSNGDSSTAGLLKYQSLQSQRYPPSPSTAYGTHMDDDDSDDLEVSLYPGARRKHKDLGPQEESLIDFLRSTGPPESHLPPSPTTPKNVRDKFSTGNSEVRKQPSTRNLKSPEPGQRRALDIFEAARVAPPRVMSPTPSVGTLKPVPPPATPYNHTSLSSPNLNQHLTVNFPSPSFTDDEYFNEKSTHSVSRQNSTIHRSSARHDDPDEIQPIRRVQSRSAVNGAAAREAVALSHTTDSLADFLKNTDPADFGAAPPTPPKAVKKAKSGFFRRLFKGDDITLTNGIGNGKIQRSGSVTSGRYTAITIPAVIRD